MCGPSVMVAFALKIEKPIELAVYLLRDDPKWSREEILAVLDEKKEVSVSLPHPVPIHLIYLTAWVDDMDIIQFRDDIYGRDTELDESLPVPAEAAGKSP